MRGFCCIPNYCYFCLISYYLNGGANKKNVQSLEDYIRNEVNKLCSDEEIKLKTQ